MENQTAPDLGSAIEAQVNQLARVSTSANEITRLYLTSEHRLAADLILGWMREAGMASHLDAVGNVCGRYEGEKPALPALLLGSHYDTVRNAGRWDGPLGLITAIACVADLSRRGKRLPFAVEVIGFADEEGVRFPVALTGSRAVAGILPESSLTVRDSFGITMRKAMADFGLDADRIGEAARLRNEFHGYVELHIEQGPLLESENEPVGIVTAISGATRLGVDIVGIAGHAGTVPMRLRHDALAGAAECVLEIEKYCRTDETLVGTVGSLSAQPGATNVIAGLASFTIDIRSVSDDHRHQAVADIIKRVESVAYRRGLTANVTVTHETQTVPCAPWLKAQIADAVRSTDHRPIELASGAGHDGMAMAAITDIAMIFVRCRGGVSHNPSEHVEPADILAGARVMSRFIEHFRGRD